MAEPLVSIIMPAYNAEKYIEEAIESILNQTYSNWELLICDDCSSDRTRAIVKEYKDNNKRIKLFELKENSGAAKARNTSIEQAKGEYISFLDSDDVWFETKLSDQINFMTKNNYLFSCTYYNKIDGNSKSLAKVIRYKNEADFEELLKNCPGNSTVVYNSKVLGKFYISSIRKRNDYLMWFQVIDKSKKIYCLDRTLSSHRVIENSLSNNKKDLIKYHWRIYRKELNLGVFKSSYYCMYWIYKGLKIKILK